MTQLELPITKAARGVATIEVELQVADSTLRATARDILSEEEQSVSIPVRAGDDSDFDWDSSCPDGG